MRKTVASGNWRRRAVALIAPAALAVAGGGSWRRRAVVLIAPAALAVAGGGSALAASGPAAAPAGGSSAVTCTVHWVGLGGLPDWTTAKNWSTGVVPGPADDVCIGTGVDVLTDVSIQIHSLHLGPEAGIALEGSATHPLTATVAASVDLTPGGVSRLDLTYATVHAARINNQGGIIYTDGNVSLTSPDIVFGHGGSLQAANGTTTLASLPQLSQGTLAGASISTSSATVMLPGDITRLVSANVGVGANSAILDQAGHNALTGLSAIDAQSSLLTDMPLALTGSLVTSGNVTVGGTSLTIPGSYTQAQGTLYLFGAPSGTLSASQVLIDQGASLLAAQSSAIMGNLVNNGFADAFGGTTQVSGSYTQGSGATLASGFGGLLAVTGQATLAGAIAAAEAIPSAGATSPVITFASLSGNFTSHNLGINVLTKTQEIDAIIQPQIAPSATTVSPNQSVTVNGASFQLGESVSIFLDRVTSTPLGATSAHYGGRFAVPVTIPAETAAGQHKLIAVGSNGNRAQVTITVN